MLFVFSKFRGSHWQNYTPDKRLQILQALENKMAKKQHRKPTIICVNPDLPEGCLGLFEATSINNQHIFINDQLLYHHKLRFHAMETIIHEGRHAYQYDIVRRKHIPFLNFTARRWKKNWQAYFTATDNPTIYNMQAIERDAQKYTIVMLKNLAYKYKNETAFKSTLKNCIQRFEQGELDARKEYGLFFQHKIDKVIDRKTRR